MLVIIIPFILMLVGIYFVLIANGAVVPFWVNDKKYKAEHNNKSYKDQYHDSSDGFEIFGWIMTVCFAAWFLIDVCCFINLERTFDQTVDNYSWLKTQAEENCELYAIGGESSLPDRVFDMNETIMHHKNMLHSSWNGVYMSEKIAELEPITIKSYIKRE